MPRSIYLALTTLVQLACASESDPETVATGGDHTGHAIPDGDGPDTAVDDGAEPNWQTPGTYVGRYTLQRYTEACTGRCGLETIVCDVGDSDERDVMIEQDGSAIRLEVEEGRITGTVDSLGAVALQGVATEEGGALALQMDFSGGFSERHGALTGEMLYSVKGFYDGETIDCVGTVDIAAEWKSDECHGDDNACPPEFPFCNDEQFLKQKCTQGADDDPCENDGDCLAPRLCDGVCVPP